MPMINFTNPVILLVVTLIYVLILILSKETKKSVITAIMLFAFIAILVVHTIMYMMGDNLTSLALSTLNITIPIDLIFILLSFIAYLWIDDIEAKVKKKKSIDNSLDWFWGKV